MELYINILRLFLDRETYQKFHEVIDSRFLKDNHPELWKVLQSYEPLFHTLTGAQATVVDLEAAFRTAYPASTDPVFPQIFQRIAEATADSKVLGSYLDGLAGRASASELAFLALDVAEGKASFEALSSAVDAYQAKQAKPVADSKDVFVSQSLEKLYDVAVKEKGLAWRLKSLRRSLGPLRKGNFGFIFARPEAGKTTFLADQVTCMAGQADGPVLWFNNEEVGENVGLRCFSAALAAPLERVIGDRKGAEAEYQKRTKGNILIRDDANISRNDIERLCAIHKPSLIVVDQLDKVKGFAADRDDLLLGAIYMWARELAKRYAPVIGVSQSDGSGEGQKWLHMGNVANAKTAKQAEADWILGIGVSYNDPPNVRGFSICKNKLVGGEESVPALRHSRWEVLLQPEIGRYADIHKE